MMHSPDFPYCISLNQLEFPVFLGITPSEQAQPQYVSLSAKIFFAELPVGADDDNGNYLCYDKLAKTAINCANKQEFRLIEYLTMQIYNSLREEINQELGKEGGGKSRIWLKICKNPPVSYKIQSTSFEYTDLFVK